MLHVELSAGGLQGLNPAINYYQARVLMHADLEPGSADANPCLLPYLHELQ